MILEQKWKELDIVARGKESGSERCVRVVLVVMGCVYV